MVSPVQLPLNASATTAGALFSSGVFRVPPYQREYAWQGDETEELWRDLQLALTDESYFLGLIILTNTGDKTEVVDGQQRLLTLTMLAAALQHEAIRHGRKALAERLEADFLRSIDYTTDATHPRIELADKRDEKTLLGILDATPGAGPETSSDGESFSALLLSAYRFLRENLREDLAADPFKRLGQWTDFLTNRLYFAVFVHPNQASAYRVFEVINTRGRQLTTADLLKNYVLSQTRGPDKDAQYDIWQGIARPFGSSGSTTFVQYIRHVVTTHAGHILSKDLYDYLAQRGPVRGATPTPPSASELVGMLEGNLPKYLQMTDPTTNGPADELELLVFSALNQLNVISVRPMLLAMTDAPRADEGMTRVLRLVVRRIVVGNLGTGAVERRFGDAARLIAATGTWEKALEGLRDLDPPRGEFEEQLRKRSYNKGTIAFIRRSILQRTMTPELQGTLYSVRPRYAPEWWSFSDEEFTFWGSTIGNTFLADAPRRPFGANDWEGFKEVMLPLASQGEVVSELEKYSDWAEDSVASVGERLAALAGAIWYD